MSFKKVAVWLWLLNHFHENVWRVIKLFSDKSLEGGIRGVERSGDIASIKP